MFRVIYVILVLLSLNSQFVFAQNSKSDSLAEISRRVDIIAQELEKQKLGEAAVTADQSAYGLGPAASKIYRTERGVSIGGYGEMVYNKFAGKKDDGSAGGKVDQADFLRAIIYIGYKFNNKWLLNTEFEFEHATTGAAGEVSAEFVHLEYLYRPELNFRFGLVLVPMGLVNELHEPTVFMGVGRPDIEQAIIPSTWRENGAGVFGNVGPLAYRSYIVNGLDASGFSSSGIRGGRQKGSKAKADHFAWTGRADVTPIPGVMFGGSIYAGYSGQDIDMISGSPSLNVATGIFEGHVDIRYQGVWFSLLGARAQLGDVSMLNQASVPGRNDGMPLTGNQSIGDVLQGFYVQAGYDLLTRTKYNAQSLMPYIRHERYNTQSSVPSGFSKDGARNINSTTVGMAWNPESRIVFKVDFKNVNNKAGTGLNQWNGQIGYIF